MRDDNTSITNQLEYLEALIEVLPRENYIKLYDIICDSEDEAEAREKIMGFFELTEAQAQFISEMKLQSFSLEESKRLKEEYQELKKIQKVLDKNTDFEHSSTDNSQELELHDFSGASRELFEDEKVLNITNSVKDLIGNHVKYAAVGGKIVRNPMRESLIEETDSGFVLNPDWEGSVYILFENGAEIEVSGSDYVSVIVRNDHK